MHRGRHEYTHEYITRRGPVTIRGTLGASAGLLDVDIEPRGARDASCQTPSPCTSTVARGSDEGFAYANRLTNSSVFSATSRQPASIVSACPRPAILTISVTPLLRFCFL